jgi:predicted RNase H-like HicB family nuclease
MKKYKIIIEKNKEGNLIASVPAIRGAYTEAEGLPTLLENIKEVIEVWTEIDKENTRPLEFVGV